MRTRRGRARLVGFLAVVAAALLPGCRHYEQDSPDSVLASARKMIAERQAQRLPDLIYADSADMRKLLNQMGQTLGALQDLALAVQQAYPKEIAKLTAEAQEAAKNGEASSYLQKMMSQAGSNLQGGRRRRGGNTPQIPGGDPDEMRKTFDNALKELFADPYGWLAQSEGRISTVSMGDDGAAIMWDGKPVFGVGLTMRRDKGKWYIVLPTSFPGVSSVMPKSPEGWEILGGLFEVFDNAFTDLATDVKKGKCKRLDDLASRAGEKMFLPAAMVVFAYSQLMNADRKAQKAAGGDKAPGGGVQFGSAPPRGGNGPGISVQIGSEPRPEAPAPPK